MRIVAADDSGIIRDELRSTLRQSTHELVAIGTNGQDGLNLAREHKPDAILFDSSMPVLDGPSAARMLRAERPDLIIVLVTSMQSEDHVGRIIDELGASWLRKPFRPKQLVQALDQIAAGQRIRPGV